MIDFVLGAGLAALLIRGWLRGLVREAIGLGVIFLMNDVRSSGSSIKASLASSQDCPR
ncbi:MAG: hypothetical protein HKN91_04790, partial [Acidimicrobiia bacterium]|nr:hypothetical protein [Acidimicrobiia bacterium]